MDWFNGIAISALNKNLDGLWAREQAISENIANYNTPGYKRKYVTFENELLSNLQRNDQHSSKVAADIMSLDIKENTSLDTTLSQDGNNVDIEVENIEMARTQINYAYTVKNLDEYFARLRTAIKG